MTDSHDKSYYCSNCCKETEYSLNKEGESFAFVCKVCLYPHYVAEGKRCQEWFWSDNKRA